MIAQKWIIVCDLCGMHEDAKRKTGQYNEQDYVPPDGWECSLINPDVHFCPTCRVIMHERNRRRMEK